MYDPVDVRMSVLGQVDRSDRGRRVGGVQTPRPLDPPPGSTTARVNCLHLQMFSK